jgi:hypothetical protein
MCLKLKLLNGKLSTLSRQGESICHLPNLNIHAFFKTERNDGELGFKISNAGC